MSMLQNIGDVVGFLLLSVVAIIENIVKVFIPLKYKMKDISGDIALVTGGAGGLGRLLALRLAKLGAIVVVWDIDRNGVEETVKLVQAAGGTCYGYVCDLCDREDVYRKATKLKEEIGKVSILINNAGVVSAQKLLDIPDKNIIRTMDVNIMSHFWTVKAFLPGMIESNKGHIVTIASMAGQVGMSELTDYCASKFAAFGFSEALRLEIESEGYDINTTSICPYFIRSTGMFMDINTRYMPILNANDVAERVITAMRCNEKVVTLPGFCKLLLSVKWIVPWTCQSMLLRNIVTGVVFHEKDMEPMAKNILIEKEKSSISMKNKNGDVIHEELARRMSSSERKP